MTPKQKMIGMFLAGGAVATLISGGTFYLMREHASERGDKPAEAAWGGSSQATTSQPASQEVDSDSTIISSSELLKSQRIRVIPAEIDKIAPAVVKLGLKEVNSKEEAFLLADDDRTHPLAPDPGEYTLSWGCNGDTPASGLRITDGNDAQGNLVVVKPKVSQAEIFWKTAKNVEKDALGCRAMPAGFKVEKVSIGATPALSGDSIYYARWNSGLTQEQCQAAGQAHPDAAPDLMIEEQGIIKSDGTCLPLFVNHVDCDSQGYQKGTTGPLVGTFGVSVGEQKEIWLIFRASGYDGAAYMAIKLDQQAPKPTTTPDFYVYEGC